MALFAYLCAHGRRFGAHLGTQWEGAYIAPIIWTIGGVEDAGRVQWPRIRLPRPTEPGDN